MGALFDVLFYVTDAMQTGEPVNGYLDKLPPDIAEHLHAVVTWILGLMGW